MPRTEPASTASSGDASQLSVSSLTHTRGVETLDYDLSAVDAFEGKILQTLRTLIASNSVDGETLRALDAHLAAGQRELEVGLDVQRSHHVTVAASLVNIASSNLTDATARLDRMNKSLDRAVSARESLEAKLDRHDPEGNNHV